MRKHRARLARLVARALVVPAAMTCAVGTTPAADAASRNVAVRVYDASGTNLLHQHTATIDTNDFLRFAVATQGFSDSGSGEGQVAIDDLVVTDVNNVQTTWGFATAPVINESTTGGTNDALRYDAANQRLLGIADSGYTCSNYESINVAATIKKARFSVRRTSGDIGDGSYWNLYAGVVPSDGEPIVGSACGGVTGRVDNFVGVVVEGDGDGIRNTLRGHADGNDAASGYAAALNTGYVVEIETGSSSTPPPSGSLSQSFDGAVDWTFSGLWHVKSTSRAVSAPNTIWYGSGSTGNYDTGATTAGSAVSPSFTVPASSPTLTFKSWHSTESGLSYDKKTVEISTNGGTSWSVVSQLDGAQQTWNSESFSLAGWAGQTARLRFHFDSVDSAYNAYEGWYVDDVVVAGGTVTNNPPTLAYTGETNYTSDGIHPNSGSTQTTYTYRVKVTDDSAALSFVRVYIDGDLGHDMTKVSGSLATGAIYSYSTTLPTGSHYYAFSASDGVTAVALPSSGVLSGPAVSLGAGLHQPSVTQSSGTSEGQSLFKVQFLDPNNNVLPSYVKVVVNGASYLMSQVDYNDTTVTDGVWYHLSVKLPAGSHSHYFTALSPPAPTYRNPASGTIAGPSVSRANLPPVAAFNVIVRDGNTVKKDADTGATVWVDAGPSGDDSDEDPITYSWNWGDNTANGSGATASHTYAAEGTYTITLTTSDTNGFDVESKTVVVGTNELRPSQAESGTLSGSGAQKFWKFYVPVGMLNLKVDLAGPTTLNGPDFDLYVKAGSKPTRSVYDGRGFGVSATESVTINNPQRGWYYVMADSYNGSGNFTVSALATGPANVQTYIADNFDSGSAPGWTLNATGGGAAQVANHQGAAHSAYHGLYLLSQVAGSTATASKSFSTVTGSFSAQSWVAVPYEDSPFQDFTVLQIGPNASTAEIKIGFKDNDHDVDVYNNGTWIMDVAHMTAGLYMPVRIQAGPTQWELYIYDELVGAYSRSGASVSVVGTLGDASSSSGFGEVYLDDIVFRTGDTDADGVADIDEVTGKDIVINGTTRRVTSDPYFWDTDADYRSDLSEAYSTVVSDPRNSDTDGDSLYDGLETDLRVGKDPAVANTVRTAAVDVGAEKVSYGLYVEGAVTGDFDVIVPFLQISPVGMKARGSYDITNEQGRVDTQAFVGIPGIQFNALSVPCGAAVSCSADVGFTMALGRTDQPQVETAVGFVTVGWAGWAPTHVDIHPTNWYLTPAINWIYGGGQVATMTAANGTQMPVSAVRTPDGALHYFTGSAYSISRDGEFSSPNELPGPPDGFDPATLAQQSVDLL